MPSGYFVKYREKCTRNWGHATLSTRKSDHSAPAGAELDVGLAGEKGVGVFLYRSAEGKGTWSNTGVRLKWLHRDDGVENTARTDIRVNALEMVYVPRGSYLVGEKGEVAGSFCDGATVLKGMKGGGSWITGNVLAFRITGEAELTLTNAPGFLWGTYNMGSPGKLPAQFPKGYAAFYCMKYEISQGEYAAFLNQLPETQAAARYPRATIQARFLERSDFHSITNDSGAYVALKPGNSCNWLSWADGAAYADWAALRPMSELEYEKACRGPLELVTNESAWGNSFTLPFQEGLLITNVCPWGKSTVTNTVALDHRETPLPPYPEGICGKERRTEAGSTYWGIATISGHLRERVVNIGLAEGRQFTGLCGDGALATNGLADVTGWPDDSAAGVGSRGGPWYDDSMRLRVSDRYLSVVVRRERAEMHGFRAVRQAP